MLQNLWLYRAGYCVAMDLFHDHHTPITSKPLKMNHLWCLFLGSEKFMNINSILKCKLHHNSAACSPVIIQDSMKQKRLVRKLLCVLKGVFTKLYEVWPKCFLRCCTCVALALQQRHVLPPVQT